MNIHLDPPVAAVRAIVAEAGLPMADLDDGDKRFLGCGPPDDPIAVVGLELCGEHALLMPAPRHAGGAPRDRARARHR